MPDSMPADWNAPNPLFPLLRNDDQAFLRELATRHRFSSQEQRQLSEIARDLQQWHAQPLATFWPTNNNKPRKQLMKELRQQLHALRTGPKKLTPEPLKPAKLARDLAPSERKIHGMCPVAAPETVCCNLRTIDAVENCGFGCSYCTIQTFYGQAVTFDAELASKLNKLAADLDPGRLYHFGTGQSSDSLMWGNQHGILDDLCAFASQNPNILLEFKTKSKNVQYFLKQSQLPPNIVCSWSLSPQSIIEAEEHFTASLDERLAAARSVADRGVRVSFHFHPMIIFDGWQDAYQQLANRLQDTFSPEEILFISFGSVTFIRPVIRAIRERERPTKMLQMDLVPTAKGKLSYPPELKKQQFSLIFQSFAPWHDQVFFYLCMEEAEYWTSTFGRVYPDNDSFEHALLTASRAKLPTTVSSPDPSLS